MVSNAKRMKYVSDDASTSDEISFSDDEFHPNQTQDKCNRRPTRKPKVFSRNALMARENRLKKKMYMSNLETEVSNLKSKNKKLTAVVSNQSSLISELEKEVKYLKSVLSNSRDISVLVRNIRHSTGMSVSTSLDRTVNDVFVVKKNAPIAKKTAHPWDEDRNDGFATFPTPELSIAGGSDSFLDDFDLNLDLKPDDLFGDMFEDARSVENALNEHNYTVASREEDKEDVGVCLHVSKHRVSLEFCSSCSENAQQAWES